MLFIYLLILGHFEITVGEGKLFESSQQNYFDFFLWLLAILNDTICYMECLHSSDCLSEVVSQNGYLCKRPFWQNNLLHILLIEEKVDSDTLTMKTPLVFISFCHAG